MYLVYFRSVFRGILSYYKMENDGVRSGAQSRVASATSARDRDEETEFEDQETDGTTPSTSALVRYVINCKLVFYD